jgi:hypothetical protein
VVLEEQALPGVQMFMNQTLVQMEEDQQLEHSLLKVDMVEVGALVEVLMSEYLLVEE